MTTTSCWLTQPFFQMKKKKEKKKIHLLKFFYEKRQKMLSIISLKSKRAKKKEIGKSTATNFKSKFTLWGFENCFLTRNVPTNLVAESQRKPQGFQVYGIFSPTFNKPLHRWNPRLVISNQLNTRRTWFCEWRLATFSLGPQHNPRKKSLFDFQSLPKTKASIFFHSRYLV